MKDECLICGAPLIYLEKDNAMECAVCHKKESSKTVCEKGHYVCDECHTAGIDAVIGLCLAETSKNPIHIMRKLFDLPLVPYAWSGASYYGGGVPPYRL